MPSQELLARYRPRKESGDLRFSCTSNIALKLENSPAKRVSCGIPTRAGDSCSAITTFQTLKKSRRTIDLAYDVPEVESGTFLQRSVSLLQQQVSKEGWRLLRATKVNFHFADEIYY